MATTEQKIKIEKPIKEQLQNWSNDIAELENYFASIELPTQPVKLNGCSTITDCSLFIESHLAIVKANNGKRTFLPYLNRLQELKQVLTINSNWYEYKTVEIELQDKEAKKEWIIKNQLGRRNLTEQEASYYRGKLYESRKRQGARTDLTLAQNGLKLNTAEELGKQYGVDEKTIRRDAEFSKVVDKVAEEIGKEAKEAIL